MSKADNILRKVRALLAQAEDPSATPAEAEAFSAKAEELMARYAIDAALIAHREGTAEKPEARRLDLTAPYTLPKACLLNGIAQHNRCKVIRHGNGRNMSATAVGYPSDLDAVELLFTSLLLQATHAQLAAVRERDTMQPAESVSFRTSFMYGFANTVEVRFAGIARRAAGDAETSEPGSALVLRDRQQDVNAAFTDLFPNTTSKATGSIGSRTGYHSGSAAANRADLGQSRVGGTRTAIA